MYWYVDTKEMLEEPKKGHQWCAWYVGSSQNNPGGREFTDVIRGEEAGIRAMTEEALEAFLKMAYHRAPFVKPREIIE